MKDTQTIQLWHGSRRWSNPPEIRPPRKGRYEYGYGIYCTNRIATASKYSKGGGLCLLMSIDPNLSFLEEVRIETQKMFDFVRGVPRLKNRDGILKSIDRVSSNWNGEAMTADILPNIFVNHKIHGNPAKLLIEWLVAQGIDASLTGRSNEDYLIVLNPSKIISAEPKIQSKIDWNVSDFDSVREQIRVIKEYDQERIKAID